MNNKEEQEIRNIAVRINLLRFEDIRESIGNTINFWLYNIQKMMHTPYSNESEIIKTFIEALDDIYKKLKYEKEALLYLKRVLNEIKKTGDYTHLLIINQILEGIISMNKSRQEYLKSHVKRYEHQLQGIKECPPLISEDHYDQNKEGINNGFKFLKQRGIHF